MLYSLLGTNFWREQTFPHMLFICIIFSKNDTLHHDNVCLLTVTDFKSINLIQHRTISIRKCLSFIGNSFILFLSAIMYYTCMLLEFVFNILQSPKGLLVILKNIYLSIHNDCSPPVFYWSDLSFRHTKIYNGISLNL